MVPLVEYAGSGHEQVPQHVTFALHCTNPESDWEMLWKNAGKTVSVVVLDSSKTI